MPQTFVIKAKEALDNRSPAEAIPCIDWELRALTGAAEALSRVSLTNKDRSRVSRDRSGVGLVRRPANVL
jgi:hypothetical protein